MTPLSGPPLRSRILGWVPFVVSAALAAYALQMAIENPGPAVAVGAIALLWLAPSLRARRRMRRLLRSGDADAVLDAWNESLDGVPHPETMAPLIRATALAANGHVERARAALSRAHRGPAWDAAIEQRILVDTLLDAFEGNTGTALNRVETLRRLPLPQSPMLRARVSDLRKAMSAFARAFAHCPNRGDVDMLVRVGKSNPLVQWALWYAAAVAAVDRGEPRRAKELLDRAPEWPTDSVFKAFHEEIATHAKVEEA
jgi:tetratricopeptide (TPR) repeat protein